MKEKTAELKEKIEKDYKDMMAVINSTSLPLFVEDTIEDMYILIETLIAENKELKETIKNNITLVKDENGNYEELNINITDYIPKSKVEEEIDKLNKSIVDAKEGDYDFIGECRIKKYALQSLLGKE